MNKPPLHVNLVGTVSLDHNQIEDALGEFLRRRGMAVTDIEFVKEDSRTLPPRYRAEIKIDVQPKPPGATPRNYGEETSAKPRLSVVPEFQP